MDTLLPIVCFFFCFFLFFFGGGLFNVKYKLFFIVFSAISNIFLLVPIDYRMINHQKSQYYFRQNFVQFSPCLLYHACYCNTL